MDGHSSKELLYSEYTGTSVVGHVLETLEKKSDKLHESIESFKKRKKSGLLERAKNLMRLIENGQNAASNDVTENLKNVSNLSQDVINKEVEVLVAVDENSPESNVDAWFMLNLAEEQESKYSGDELRESSSSERILDFSDSSDTDTSDDESDQNFPVNADEFILNGTESSNSSQFSEDITCINSPDVNDEHYKSARIVEENMNYANNDDVSQLSIPLKNGRKMIKILDNDSSDDLNPEFENHSPSCNSNTLSYKRTIISDSISNDSENNDEYLPSISTSNRSEHFLENNCLGSSNNLKDTLINKRKKLTVLKTESSKHMNKNSSEVVFECDLKKKKICC